MQHQIKGTASLNQNRNENLYERQVKTAIEDSVFTIVVHRAYGAYDDRRLCLNDRGLQCLHDRRTQSIRSLRRSETVLTIGACVEQNDQRQTPIEDSVFTIVVHRAYVTESLRRSETVS
ncbi:hypothetical protein CICLE_v10002873mg [Citrus x clementina]|uniref:Uncharacterized protein n=1 Tax=Citrus clementina TaxID=85681 RepID=V4SVL9_CITCL|nr:hypothetical protein CICLE_v10002873mg [Citrus x clementina]